ncbi:Ankyrin repeat-containing domain [Phytophthora cactorum]|nr:Ankyrin repeat-containing domain [Phytophthora cactorum]
MREFLLPLLLSARVVTRYCLPEGCSELPILRCVQYVAAREVPETQDQFYKRWLLNETSELAASRGDLTTLRWLMECYLPVEPVENVVGKAAANGQFEILQWLYDQQRERVRFRDVEMCGALENKHENVVAWLRENAVPRTEYREEVLCSAVKAGNLDVVRWLCDEFGLDATGMLKFAINGCHEETARWVIDRYDVSGEN